MKTYKRDPKSELFEIIVPFGPEGFAPRGPSEEFFDDCAICQQLKKDVESGRAQAVPFQVPRDQQN